MKNMLYVATLLVATVCMAQDKPATPKSHEGMRGHAMPKEVIAKFDKDGDGKLNEAEMKAAREGMRGHAMPKEVIAKFDKDGDGKLNEAEMKAAREARQAEMLKKYDKDGDGKLTDAEKKVMREDFMKRHEAAKDAKAKEEKKDK